MKSDWNEELAQQIMKFAEQVPATHQWFQHAGVTLDYDEAARKFHCSSDEVKVIIGDLIASGYLWAKQEDQYEVHIYGVTHAWIDRNELRSRLQELQGPHE